MQIDLTQHFTASPERVWAGISDNEGMVNWAGVLRARLERPGDTERDGVGALRHLTILPGLTIVEEITGFEPPRRLNYRVVAGLPGLAYHAGEMRLTPEGDGTRLDWNIRLELRPLHPAWFGSVFLRIALELGLRKALATLSRQLGR